ncbi:hypothetical protein CP985_13000 [Malaciobacter mytili LMG 24559]|uniref:Tetratricopeptide repeat protein n=1 Tax=Malaciobacter mytili LMG 24559 TaxID=1032238 RepID=A0AAX2AC17_9BACT|nr:hypothetical protein [Malaciobacter mytili]AXH15568.1 hypothetical protein AMYT_2001 [Malaciobacter mytili LMG 24559]RXK13749.1 hypothetical protein CP985_13000 [Malaciobacter mytili LMG 24559]
MSDRLHEIIGQIGVFHNEFIANGKIKDADIILDELSTQEEDLQEHYFKLLLQYYFQQNDIENVKKLLLAGYKFELRMEDIQEAFCNIKSGKENVIEFLDESVVFFKDTNFEKPLEVMYKYYNSNEENKVNLEHAINIIQKNRYICAFAYKNRTRDFAKLFLNEELCESLKRDLPYLFN